MSNIYFFGDTHADLDIDKVFFLKYKADDYIIICGDFGVIWSDLEGNIEMIMLLSENLNFATSF